MKKIILSGVLLLGGIAYSSFSKDITFIDNIKPVLEFRPRYEYVADKNNNLKNANALTTRTVVGAKINSIFENPNLRAYLEATNVSALVDKFSPEKNEYDKVPDPYNSRLTQAYISYTLNKTTFIAGRKFVMIDDHRFIGNVGWRQMPQSFGIIAISDNTIKNLSILVAGIYERKAISDQLSADWRLDKMPLVFDINYKIIPQLKVKAFSYLITDVSNTYGLKASGEANLPEFSLNYLVEYAKQTDPYQKDNEPIKPDIDTSYYRLKLGLNTNGIIIGSEYTHFGDKNGKSKGFSTPFATLHKFDGWSDALLDGCVGGYDYGLNEYKFTAGYESKSVGKILVSYFIFNSAKSQPTGNSIGTEFDALYAKKLTKRLSFLTKAAFYNGKDGYYTGGNLKATKDITKYWIQLDYKY